MRLGTAIWMEGKAERRALIAPLADGRVVDLNRIERVRLAKLGEGAPEVLAEALVPPSLRKVLEAGPRALHRVKQTLAYAEKWAKRGDLPELLAPSLDRVHLQACLPRPNAVRLANGTDLDRLRVFGPQDGVAALPEVGLAALGQAGGTAAGFCLALRAGDAVLLGAWLLVGEPFAGDLRLSAGHHHRTASLDIYEGLELPDLLPGEARLLPPLRLRAFPAMENDEALEVRVAFESLAVHLGPEAVHGTVQ